MLEVADTGNDVVMLFGGDYDRERTDGPDQVRVTPDLFGVGFPVCRNKIVRVFQQVIRGAGEQIGKKILAEEIYAVKPGEKITVEGRASILRIRAK